MLDVEVVCYEFYFLNLFAIILSDASRKNSQYFFFFFFYYHPRNYYKLSLRSHLVIHVAVRYEKVLKSICPIELQSGRVHKSWESVLLNLRGVLAFLMRLIVSILEYSSILSAYFWLSLLISSLTYGMLRLRNVMCH